MEVQGCYKLQGQPFPDGARNQQINATAFHLVETSPRLPLSGSMEHSQGTGLQLAVPESAQGCLPHGPYFIPISLWLLPHLCFLGSTPT